MEATCFGLAVCLVERRFLETRKCLYLMVLVWLASGLER